MPNPRQPHGLQIWRIGSNLHIKKVQKKKNLQASRSKRKRTFKCQNLALWFSYKGFIGQQWLIFTWVQFGCLLTFIEPKVSTWVKCSHHLKFWCEDYVGHSSSHHKTLEVMDFHVCHPHTNSTRKSVPKVVGCAHPNCHSKLQSNIFGCLWVRF
jgi:hypothetical protein